MRNNDTIVLDKETLDCLDVLAEEAGMSNDEYLRKLLIDRATLRLQQQKAGASLFLPKMVECHHRENRDGKAGQSRCQIAG